MKKQRLISLTTVMVYWFAIIAGLALFTATRKDDIDLAGMWIGGIGGTALGQFLASRDLRLWFVSVILLAFVVLCGPFTPLHNGGMLFWMALIPGTLCGWLSLSDRGSLVAFWFPVVIWMLTILDRGQGALKVETGSAALLGGLAFVFIAFLFARETRRIGLWRTVAVSPIAPETVPVILKEVPRLRIGFAGWSLAVSTAAFAICAWLAPRLWHVEALVPDIYATATERPGGRSSGVKCCQDIHINEQKRSRVKEYFDIGRGHDDDIEEYKTAIEECVVCGPDGVPMDVARYGYGEGYNYGTGYYYGGNGTGGYGTGYGNGTGGYGSYNNGSYYGSTPNYNYNAPAPSYTAPQEYTAPLYTPPPQEPTPYTPPSTYTPPTPVEPLPPTVDWQPTPPEPVKPAAPTAPMPTQPEIVTPPPAVAAAPQPTQPSAPPAAPSVNAPTTTTTQAPNAPPATPPFLAWILYVLAGGFAFQFLLLGMRPIRRLVTLRHLRKPFWNETVDQRISNWWHLVLVGLRDAGWRTTTGEAPRELAKRLDIEGVESAAAILDRARHGVGIDQDDLQKMEEASEQAYRASRDRASAFARFLGWFRRPLV